MLTLFCVYCYRRRFNGCKFFLLKSWFIFQIRAIVNDFAVMLAILTMVLTDFLLGIPTPKLHVPEEFRVGRNLYKKAKTF